MIRELRADPTTQFFEPLLCSAFAQPEDFTQMQPLAAVLAMHAPAMRPATAVAELEEEMPLAG